MKSQLVESQSERRTQQERMEAIRKETGVCVCVCVCVCEGGRGKGRGKMGKGVCVRELLLNTDAQTQQRIQAEDRLSKTKALWMKTKKELDTVRKQEGELQATITSLRAQLEGERQQAELNKVKGSRPLSSHSHCSPLPFPPSLLLLLLLLLSLFSPSLPPPSPSPSPFQVEMAALTGKLQSIQQQVRSCSCPGYCYNVLHKYIHTHIHPYMHTCIHPYTHAHIHIYTHTHSPIPRWVCFRRLSAHWSTSLLRHRMRSPPPSWPSPRPSRNTTAIRWEWHCLHTTCIV